MDMPYNSGFSAKGFSLLELTVTVAIIGIVLMIAWPLYSNHLTHAKRLQAEIALIKLSNALENYFLLNNTYENATLTLLAIPETIADNAYQLHILSADNQKYQVSATPLGKQAQNDVSCATLLLDSSGIRNITGTEDSLQCWQ